MTSAQVVETSVITADSSPSQDYTHPYDQTLLLHEIWIVDNSKVHKAQALDLLSSFII